MKWVLVCVSALPEYLLIKIGQEVFNAYLSLLVYGFYWLLCSNSGTLDKIDKFCLHFHIYILFIWISYSEIYKPIQMLVVVNVDFNCYANATFRVIYPVTCACTVAQSTGLIKHVLPFTCILHETLLLKLRWSTSIHFILWCVDQAVIYGLINVMRFNHGLPRYVRNMARRTQVDKNWGRWLYEFLAKSQMKLQMSDWLHLQNANIHGLT